MISIVGSARGSEEDRAEVPADRKGNHMPNWQEPYAALSGHHNPVHEGIKNKNHLATRENRAYSASQ